MSGGQDARVRRLEALVLRQQAELDQLRAAVARLTAERDAARVERDEARREAEAARERVRELTRNLAELQGAVQRSGERLRHLVRKEFGAASERLCGHPLILDEVLDFLRADRLEQEAQASDPPAAPVTTSGNDTGAGTGAAAGGASPTGRRGRRRPANAGGRNPLPADLERRVEDYVPPADHPALRQAQDHQVVGTRTLERLAITPPELYVQVLHCPVARIRSATGLTWQETLAPPAVIARGQVDDALLVHSAVEKVADHLPAYRQERRWQRQDLDVPRAKLCRWHIALAGFLTSVAEALLREILAGAVVGIDDTVHRLIVPDQRVCRNGRLWAVASPRGIFYLFTETREGRWITELLADYTGAVMGDGYAGHRQLLLRPGILALFCWAHVRRKFFEAMDARRRTAMLGLIARLYDLEDQLRPLSAPARIVAREQRARPILAQIKELLDAWADDPKIHPGSGIARATAYTRRLWPGLVRYCEIGEADLDNNATERGMRPNALHRKNSLFSASPAGAQAYATLMTLIQSAIHHDLDPIAYLNDIIQDLHFQRRLPEELTPAAYARRTAKRCPVPDRPTTEPV